MIVDDISTPSGVKSAVLVTVAVVHLGRLAAPVRSQGGSDSGNANGAGRHSKGICTSNVPLGGSLYSGERRQAEAGGASPWSVGALSMARAKFMSLSRASVGSTPSGPGYAWPGVGKKGGDSHNLHRIYMSGALAIPVKTPNAEECVPWPGNQAPSLLSRIRRMVSAGADLLFWTSLSQFLSLQQDVML